MRHRQPCLGPRQPRGRERELDSITLLIMPGYRPARVGEQDIAFA
jgi:hypothetical protein